MKKFLLLLLLPIFSQAQTIKIRYVDSVGMEQIATFTLPHSAISGKLSDLTGATTPAVTSINKVTITAPATSATLNIKDGTTISNLASFTFDAAGSTTLVSGTKAITITGITSSSVPMVTLQSQGGTVTTTVQYKAVCSTNTLTITAMTSAKATNTSDTSLIGYFVVN